MPVQGIVPGTSAFAALMLRPRGRRRWGRPVKAAAAVRKDHPATGPWMNSAGCRGQPVEIPHPENTTSTWFIPRLCASRIISGIALAGTRVMNRMSVEGGGGRAGGVSEAPLGTSPQARASGCGWRRECRGVRTGQARRVGAWQAPINSIQRREPCVHVLMIRLRFRGAVTPRLGRAPPRTTSHGTRQTRELRIRPVLNPELTVPAAGPDSGLTIEQK